MRLIEVRMTTGASTGVFEVQLNGRELYSKQATGPFADDEEIVTQAGDCLFRTA